MDNQVKEYDLDDGKYTIVYAPNHNNAPVNIKRCGELLNVHISANYVLAMHHKILEQAAEIGRLKGDDAPKPLDYSGVRGINAKAIRRLIDGSHSIDDLGNAFVWDATPEGDVYWNDQYNLLQDDDRKNWPEVLEKLKAIADTYGIAYSEPEPAVSTQILDQIHALEARIEALEQSNN